MSPAADPIKRRPGLPALLVDQLGERHSTSNMVLVWQQYAVEALSSPGLVGAGYTPPVAGVHLPIVQGRSTTPSTPSKADTPYLDNVPSAPATASKAAAAAAHHVLVGLVPALPLVVRHNFRPVD